GDRRLESAAATSKTWGGARLPRVVQNKTSTEWYRRAKATKRREMDTRQSERPVVPQKLGHLTRGTQRREERAGGTDPQEGNEPRIPGRISTYTKLRRIA